jgi:ABC-type uncharacterized transport system YnjBCD permease subunit
MIFYLLYIYNMKQIHFYYYCFCYIAFLVIILPSLSSPFGFGVRSDSLHTHKYNHRIWVHFLHVLPVSLLLLHNIYYSINCFWAISNCSSLSVSLHSLHSNSDTVVWLPTLSGIFSLHWFWDWETRFISLISE